MVSMPFGSSEPAIHFLRDVTGLTGVRNQVAARARGDRLQGMIDPAGRDHHVGAPGGGDLAGLDLGLHAAAGEFRIGGSRHRLDLRRDALHHRNQLGVGAGAGRRVVEPVDVRQQHQEVGAHHGRDPGSEAVIVAVTDFVGGDRVVLVDDGHRAPFQQLGDGGARVEIAAALLGVAERDQDLAGAHPVHAERRGPGAGELDLADRGGGLAVLELERPASAA